MNKKKILSDNDCAILMSIDGAVNINEDFRLNTHLNSFFDLGYLEFLNIKESLECILTVCDLKATLRACGHGNVSCNNKNEYIDMLVLHCPDVSNELIKKYKFVYITDYASTLIEIKRNIFEHNIYNKLIIKDTRSALNVFSKYSKIFNRHYLYLPSKKFLSDVINYFLNCKIGLYSFISDDQMIIYKSIACIDYLLNQKMPCNFNLVGIYDGLWVPDDFSYDLSTVYKIIKNISNHVHQHFNVQKIKENEHNFIQLEIEFWDRTFSCDACCSLIGHIFNIDEEMDLPPINCTCEFGSHIKYLPVKNRENYSVFKKDYFQDMRNIKMITNIEYKKILSVLK